MHQVTSQELEKCSTSESTLRQNGEVVNMQDIIAYSSRRIWPYLDLEASMLCKSSYSFLSDMTINHILMHWYNGLYLLETTLVKKLVCG